MYISNLVSASYDVFKRVFLKLVEFYLVSAQYS